MKTIVLLLALTASAATTQLKPVTTCQWPNTCGEAAR